MKHKLKNNNNKRKNINYKSKAECQRKIRDKKISQTFNDNCKSPVYNSIDG